MEILKTKELERLKLLDLAQLYFNEAHSELFDELQDKEFISIIDDEITGITDISIKTNLSIDELKEFIEICSGKYYHHWELTGTDWEYFGYETREYNKYVAKQGGVR